MFNTVSSAPPLNRGNFLLMDLPCKACEETDAACRWRLRNDVGEELEPGRGDIHHIVGAVALWCRADLRGRVLLVEEMES